MATRSKVLIYVQRLVALLIGLSLGLYLLSGKPEDVFGARSYNGKIESVECDYRKSKDLTYINFTIDTNEVLGFKEKGDLCQGVTEYIGEKLISHYLRGFVLSIAIENQMVVKYSDRKNTLAAKMGHKLNEPVKARRLKTLQALQRTIVFKKNRALEGTQVEVLVEGSSKRGGQLMGRTETNKIVNFTCNSSPIGDIVNVMIRRGLVNSLQGELSE